MQAHFKWGRARQWAAGALGQVGDPRTIEPLITALHDEESNVGQKAAGALRQIGTPEAVAALENARQEGTGAISSQICSVPQTAGKRTATPGQYRPSPSYNALGLTYPDSGGAVKLLSASVRVVVHMSMAARCKL